MLTVTAQELVTRIRQRTRRENSGFLTDAEYLQLVDVAWRRCYNRMAKKVPRYFAVDYPLTLVAGQQLYTLPAAFRSSQSIHVLEPSTASYRELRPLQEVELQGLTAPLEAAEVRIKYTPEPSRVTALADVLPVIATSDEWIVNCVAQMGITKEGTERQPYDMDFQLFDKEMESFLDDFDQGRPQTVNETFMGDYYSYPRTIRVEGYVLRGTQTAHEIQFWACKFPAIYL